MARNEKLFWYSLLVSFIAILVIGFANPAVFAQTQDSPDYIIKIKSFGFVPTFAVVSSGTNVVWVNENGMMQIVTAPDAFGTQEIGPGMNFSFRFLEPGVYEYRTTSATGVLVVD
jgi:plastocyanin